jgi:transcriptional regulator with XRE-family HTH domain
MLRTKKCASLRKFCLQNEIDSSNISKLERGVLPPPNEKVLKYYAECLGLKEGSPERLDLFELASAEKIKLPKHLSESELVERIPALFRAARTKKGAKHIVAKLKKILKETWTA